MGSLSPAGRSAAFVFAVVTKRKKFLPSFPARYRGLVIGAETFAPLGLNDRTTLRAVREGLERNRCYRGARTAPAGPRLARLISLAPARDGRHRDNRYVDGGPRPIPPGRLPFADEKRQGSVPPRGRARLPRDPSDASSPKLGVTATTSTWFVARIRPIGRIIYLSSTSSAIARDKVVTGTHHGTHSAALDPPRSTSPSRTAAIKHGDLVMNEAICAASHGRGADPLVKAEAPRAASRTRNSLQSVSC